MSKLDALDRKLRERLLLGERREGDHLVLADDTLRAALDGSRRLTPAESAALQASPLTVRRPGIACSRSSHPSRISSGRHAPSCRSFTRLASRSAAHAPQGRAGRCCRPLRA